MGFLKRCLSAAVCLTAIASPWWPASAFALRGIEAGGKVPDIELSGINIEGGKLSSFVGPKGLVVVYWATWSSRSPAILQFAEKELRRYANLGLNVIAVNADHQEMKAEDFAAVREMVKELGLTLPVLYDKGLVGYNEIGVISTPTTLILDNTLAVKDAYPGFPSVAKDDIPETDRRVPRNRPGEARGERPVPPRPQAEKQRSPVLQPREAALPGRSLPLWEYCAAAFPSRRSTG